MIFRVLDEAADEIVQAAAYYEEAESGLGSVFRLELDTIVERIVAQPLLHSAQRDGLRRVNFSTFRFYVAYTVREQTIYVIAVSHAARRPGYFLGRLRRKLPPS